MKKYYVLIGNYGSGKTELALNFAFNAAERGLRVQVVYCYVPEPDRHGEALNGLWYSGMRTLPVFFITEEENLEVTKAIECFYRSAELGREVRAEELK